MRQDAKERVLIDVREKLRSMQDSYTFTQTVLSDSAAQAVPHMPELPVRLVSLAPTSTAKMPPVMPSSD